MDVINFNEEASRARGTLHVVQQFNALRIHIRTTFPGCDLVVIRGEGPPELVAALETAEEGFDFMQLKGIEQVEHVISKIGPHKKVDILREVHRLGGTMSIDSLATYLLRGKQKKLFTQCGRTWAMGLEIKH